ncbi:hypothetical protein KM043_000324 [Ampulex compressa]|nr:hypothetical protein KM043_000324 [Ampulex compressa]
MDDGFERYRPSWAAANRQKDLALLASDDSSKEEGEFIFSVKVGATVVSRFFVEIPETSFGRNPSESMYQKSFEELPFADRLVRRIGATLKGAFSQRKKSRKAPLADARVGP